MMVITMQISIVLDEILILELPPPAITQWNGGGSSGTSDGVKSFGNNNNDENSNPSGNGGFGSRNGGGFSGNYFHSNLGYHAILFSF